MFGLLKNIKLKICHLKASILKKEIKTTYVWRFIFSHRDISPQKKSVKYTAFFDKRDNDLSVYDKKVSEDKMFKIGDSFVGSCHIPPKETIAAGELTFEVLTNLNLKLISYPCPHKLHINIVNIPHNDISKKRHIAHMLAESAKLIQRKD